MMGNVFVPDVLKHILGNWAVSVQKREAVPSVYRLEEEVTGPQVTTMEEAKVLAGVSTVAGCHGRRH